MYVIIIEKRKNMNKENLLVIVAGSGTGKTVLLKELCENYNFEKLVTTTTRMPRKNEGEIDGVHYFFVSKEQFLEMDKKGDLIEKNEFNNNFYGLGKNALENIKKEKKPAVILEANGAKNAKEKLSKDWNVIAVYIDENLETRIERTIGRGDSGDNIKSRLNIMKNEEQKWKSMLDYDLITSPGKTTKELAQIINDFFVSQKKEKKIKNRLKP